MTTQFHLLKTRRYLPLFITQFLGAFNDNVYKNSVVILITYRIAAAQHLSAQLLVTLAAGIFILPFFLFSANAGQWADKYTKSSIIPIVKFAEIVLALIAAIGFYTESVVLLMVVLFMLGMQATFFGPIKYAILPELLHENELIAGNGLIEAATFLAILLGTISGGVLILLPWGEHLISFGVLFIALSGFITCLLIPKTKQHDPLLKLHLNFIAETYRVVRYSIEHRGIFAAIVGISWFWLIGAVFLAEMPVFTKDLLHGDQHVVTMFIALFSIGIALGSLLCNSLMQGQVHLRYVPYATLGMTIFIVDLYFASCAVSSLPVDHLISPITLLSTFNGWRILFDFVFLSVCGGLYTVPLYASLQKFSKGTHRARVIASNNVVNAMFMAIAAFTTLLMLKAGMTVNQVFLTLGILNLGMVWYLAKVKQV